MPRPTGSDDVPENLRPYRFHGVDVGGKIVDGNVYCDCPFCGAEGKFSVEVETSKFRCFVCNEGVEKGAPVRGGNSTDFLRLWWKYCDAATIDYAELAEQRGLLYPETLIRWGACKGLIKGDWMLPGYSPRGALVQLYRYVPVKQKDETYKHRLIPTPEVGGHAILGMTGFDRKKPIVEIFESWNALAAEEVFERTAIVPDDDDAPQWVETARRSESMMASRNVIAFPGCAVFAESWPSLLSGKQVNLWFDNDHPKEQLNGRVVPGAGWTYSVRDAMALEGVADSVSAVKWGPEGHDPELPSGFDVRDALKDETDIAVRRNNLEAVHGLLTQIGEDDKTERQKQAGKKLRTSECTEFKVLTASWRRALRWRQGLEDALSILLAVCLSTDQIGDQLFLMLISDAGSGKTTFCDALLTSKYCYALEHMTGFHSGWKGDGEGGYALLDRINKKTLITSEGDVLMSNPASQQIMSQQRRIFDGKSTASYKNMKTDQSFEGLRTPWIIAGTPALLDSDQARLGDRFLKYFIAIPDSDERRQILRRAGNTEKANVGKKSGVTAASHVNEKMAEAFSLTGGYVDHLRENSERLSEITMSDEDMDRCCDLGEFTSCLRARPARGKEEVTDSKEMPTRLTKQYVRLAICLALVLNKSEVDDEVMRRIRDTAAHTAGGLTLKIARVLWKYGEEGALIEQVSALIGKTQDKSKELVRFMSSIEVIEGFRPVDEETGRLMRERWRLTEHMRGLYEQVVVNWRKDESN